MQKIMECCENYSWLVCQLFYGRIATSGLSLDVTFVNGVFILRKDLSGLQLQQRTVLEWNKICLFHFVLDTYYSC